MADVLPVPAHSKLLGFVRRPVVALALGVCAIASVFVFLTVNDGPKLSASKVPVPFIPGENHQGPGGGSNLAGSVTYIRTLSSGVELYEMDFIGDSSQQAPADKVYLIKVPSGVAPIAFERAILDSNGGVTRPYYGYIYTTANATQEIANQTATGFNVRFPGIFFASAAAMAAHGGDLTAFATINGIVFKTAGAYTVNHNNVLLDGPQLIAFVPVDQNLTIDIAEVCGNTWKGDDEECDDGDLDNGDGCSSSCLVESGFTCDADSPSVCTADAVCGDGFRTQGEACDDGNVTASDGCSATCTVESGFTCDTGTPNVCLQTCGNGIVGNGETCDDGNATAGDGCNATCQEENGFTCTGTPSVCDPDAGAPVCGNSEREGDLCGNAFVDNDEECDYAIECEFTVDGEDCTCHDDCTICDGQEDCSFTAPSYNGETCDDGDTTAGDGCDATCDVEDGFTCDTASPNVCTPLPATQADIAVTGVQSEILTHFPPPDEAQQLPAYMVFVKYSVTVKNNGPDDVSGEIFIGHEQVEAQSATGVVFMVESGAPYNQFSSWGCGSSMCTLFSTGSTTLAAGHSRIYTVIGQVFADDFICGEDIAIDFAFLNVHPDNPIIDTNTANDSQISVTSLDCDCGNGIRESMETCDDANTTAGDGCSATCAVEDAFTCTDCASGPSIFEYTSTGGTFAITDGPGDTVWYTQATASKIVRRNVDPNAAGTAFTLSGGAPDGAITLGPDGNVWFTRGVADKISRITASGTVTDFTVTGKPEGLTAGHDGNLWFTAFDGNYIGRITPSGTVTQFAIPTANSQPFMITAGPDGNVWFSEVFANKIGKITATGSITEYDIPTADSQPYVLAAGSDGNVWFTEFNGNKIGKITPSGAITEFAVPTPNSNPYGIVSGRDGNLWFTEFSGNKIGKITTAGVITEIDVELPSAQPTFITLGPDGSLWYVESNATRNRVSRIWDYECPASNTTGSVCFADVLCSNGEREAGESCDDGDTSSGDGCSAVCAIESGYSCDLAQPNVCTNGSVCGDGEIDAPEACDDGNTVAGDGCDASCAVENGYFCSGEPSVCVDPTCGNGTRELGENCDDGNTANGDGCTSACNEETGWSCNMAQPNVCALDCEDIDSVDISVGSHVITFGSGQINDRCSDNPLAEELIHEQTCNNTTLMLEEVLFSCPVGTTCAETGPNGSALCTTVGAPPPNSEEDDCVDTDGGFDIFEAGTTTNSVLGQSDADQCVNGNTGVQETYCRRGQGSVAHVSLSCANGCAANACNP